tara:strand:+ start:308 stop:559 length:252 start_codon:yes stop_codon:yes gene_type:complete
MTWEIWIQAAPKAFASIQAARLAPATPMWRMAVPAKASHNASVKGLHVDPWMAPLRGKHSVYHDEKKVMFAMKYLQNAMTPKV